MPISSRLEETSDPRGEAGDVELDNNRKIDVNLLEDLMQPSKKHRKL